MRPAGGPPPLPERVPLVRDAAKSLAESYKGAPRGKFWTDVAAALK